MTNNNNDLDAIIENLKTFQSITEKNVKYITEKAMDIFAK